MSPEEKEKLGTTGTTTAFLVTHTYFQNVQNTKVLSEFRGQNILMKSFHAVTKPFVTTLRYLNTTDMLFSTFYVSMQFSSNVQGPGKSLWETHSRYVRYAGV